MPSRSRLAVTSWPFSVSGHDAALRMASRMSSRTGKGTMSAGLAARSPGTVSKAMPSAATETVSSSEVSASRQADDELSGLGLGDEQIAWRHRTASPLTGIRTASRRAISSRAGPMARSWTMTSASCSLRWALRVRSSGSSEAMLTNDDTAHRRQSPGRRTSLRRQPDSCSDSPARKASRGSPKKKRYQKPRRRLPAGTLSATRSRRSARGPGEIAEPRRQHAHRCGPGGPGRGSGRCLRCRWRRPPDRGRRSTAR